MTDLEQVGVWNERRPWFTFPAGKATPLKDPDRVKKRRKNKLARIARRRNRT